MINEVDILAVFAHPDDMELCVGGTLLKMKSFGYRTGTLDITRGEMGTRGTPEIRAAEAAEASRILQIDWRESLELADGHVFVNEESRAKLVRVLRRVKPKVVLTHQFNDPHPDHHAIAGLVRDAARLASMQKFDGDAGLERINVPMVAHSIFSQRIVPSFVVDISDFLAVKMEALRAYYSQFHNPNSDELETRLSGAQFLVEHENRSRYFGSLIGVEAGEPFFVREMLNVEDPISLLTRPMNLYS